MRSEACHEWRESLGAYALGQLPDEERAGLEAHLEGCPDCRGELELLAPVARLLPKADPERIGLASPSPPPSLRDRVLATVADEQRTARRRRMRFGFALGGATAAIAAAALALFVLPGGEEAEPPSRQASFESLPPKMKIGAKLEPREFGTEIHVYVKGAPAGVLCRVFLETRSGERSSAGSFRYRWSENYPILTSAVEYSDAKAIGIRVGKRTFVAPVEASTS